MLALVACKKDALTLTDNDVKEQHVGNGGFRSEENPFEYIGLAHNQYLEDFYDLQYRDTTEEVILSFIQEEIGLDSFPELIPVGDMILYKTLGPDEFLATQDFIPEHVEAYANLMLAAISNASVTELDSLEETILNDTLGSNTRDPLLIGIAVAKHSLEYWTENGDNWGPDGGIQAASYAAIDATTAYFTAAACGLGYMSPPTGVTVTAFALATGATASLAAAAADGIDYVFDVIFNNL